MDLCNEFFPLLVFGDISCGASDVTSKRSPRMRLDKLCTAHMYHMHCMFTCKMSRKFCPKQIFIPFYQSEFYNQASLFFFSLPLPFNLLFLLKYEIPDVFSIHYEKQHLTLVVSLFSVFHVKGCYHTKDF